MRAWRRPRADHLHPAIGCLFGGSAVVGAPVGRVGRRRRFHGGAGGAGGGDRARSARSDFSRSWTDGDGARRRIIRYEKGPYMGSPKGGLMGPPRMGLDFAHLTRLKHFAIILSFCAFAPKRENNHPVPSMQRVLGQMTRGRGRVGGPGIGQACHPYLEAGPAPTKSVIREHSHLRDAIT
jgi:hypothetical protein